MPAAGGIYSRPLSLVQRTGHPDRSSPTLAAWHASVLPAQGAASYLLECRAIAVHSEPHERWARDGRGACKESSASSAVRDHLANKRTMLAWCQTAIAVMALGFVVARFGFILRELAPLVPRHIPAGVSTLFGTTLVAIGGVLIILATLEYLQTGRAIDRQTYHWSPALEIALSLVLVLAAAILAVYLVLTG